jgi:hypothetical protein
VCSGGRPPREGCLDRADFDGCAGRAHCILGLSGSPFGSFNFHAFFVGFSIYAFLSCDAFNLCGFLRAPLLFRLPRGLRFGQSLSLCRLSSRVSLPLLARRAVGLCHFPRFALSVRAPRPVDLNRTWGFLSRRRRFRPLSLTFLPSRAFRCRPFRDPALFLRPTRRFILSKSASLVCPSCLGGLSFLTQFALGALCFGCFASSSLLIRATGRLS